MTREGAKNWEYPLRFLPTVPEGKTCFLPNVFQSHMEVGDTGALCGGARRNALQHSH